MSFRGLRRCCWNTPGLQKHIGHIHKDEQRMDVNTCKKWLGKKIFGTY